MTATTFSILGRIEPTATFWLPQAQPSSDFAFSILGRIEPTATVGGLDRGAEEQKTFQYPRSDRAHCNPGPAGGWG